MEKCHHKQKLALIAVIQMKIWIQYMQLKLGTTSEKCKAVMKDAKNSFEFLVD